MEKQHCFGKLLMGNYVIFFFFREQIHFSLLLVFFLLIDEIKLGRNHVMHVDVPWFLRSSGGFYRSYLK